ncbi:MAG TPA: hypothetical protein ENJ68_01180 [Devosia sp.]|nr:hypothetical protein [Devosia sp.]
MTDRQVTCTRAGFNAFFRQKYLRLLKAALNRNERRPDYADPEVIKAIVAPYRDMARTPLAPDAGELGTPRHIWMLWQQGWDSAPPLVQACARSWQRHNPDWQLHLLDETSLARWAPAYSDIHAPRATRTARANIARLSLLARHGGVWADATLFCQQPLDRWLPGAMVQRFFMFSKPRPYRYSDIWFLASFPQTELITGWLDMVDSYWRHFRRPHHYYWMEYLFEYLARTNPSIGQTWEGVPPLSALGPLVTQGRAFDRNAPAPLFQAITDRVIPVHKLSHKWRYRGSLEGTPVGVLTGMEYLHQPAPDGTPDMTSGS